MRTMAEMKKHSNWQVDPLYGAIPQLEQIPMNTITCLAGGAEMLRCQPRRILGAW
jgi:hypothetical protein